MKKICITQLEKYVEDLMYHKHCAVCFNKSNCQLFQNFMWKRQKAQLNEPALEELFSILKIYNKLFDSTRVT